MQPTVDVHGTYVVVRQGGQVTKIPCGSNDAAWEHAERLESEHAADEERKAELIASYVEQGVDVVLPHPDDKLAGMVAAVSTAGYEIPGSVGVAGGAAVEAHMPTTTSGAENVRVTITDPPTELDPTPIFGLAPDESSGPFSAPKETPVIDDEPIDLSEPPRVSFDTPPVEVTGWRYNPDTSRAVIHLLAGPDAVTIWREAPAGKTSTFELDAGQNTTRNYKVQPGDRVTLRVGDENGALVFDEVIADLSAPGHNG